MADIYLENLKDKVKKYREIHIDNEVTHAMICLMEIMQYALPKKVTPIELMVFVKVIIKDIRDNECRFYHSSKLKQAFDAYQNHKSNLDMHLTWLPECIELMSSNEFTKEFMPLYAKAILGQEIPELEEEYGCIEVKPDYIDISNKNKADVLAALYNNSKPLGMGMTHYRPEPIDSQTAEAIIESQGYSFSYLRGRVMYINLEGDTLYVGPYNRDNNCPGLAQRVISKCPNTNNSTKQKQKDNKKN